MKKFFVILIIFLVSVSFESCNQASSPEEQITPPPQSDLTRKGKFIAFTSDKNGNEDIWIVQVNSTGLIETSNLIYPSNPFNLTASNFSDDRIPNWSNDGRMLVFTRETGNVQELWAFFFNDNGSLDSNVSQNPRMLFSSGGNWDNNCSFSPDGKYLVFDRRYDNDSIPGIDEGDKRDLYIGDITGSGNSFSVSNIRPVKTSPFTDEYHPEWSPKISVRRVIYDMNNPYITSDRDIRIIDPLDSASDAGYYSASSSGSGVWKPDCTRIIFETDYSNGGFFKIQVHRYPTENYTPVDLVVISGQDCRYPSMQPNGDYIVYTRFVSPNKGKLYTSISTGGTQQFLLPSEFDGFSNTYPAW